MTKKLVEYLLGERKDHLRRGKPLGVLGLNYSDWPEDYKSGINKALGFNLHWQNVPPGVSRLKATSKLTDDEIRDWLNVFMADSGLSSKKVLAFLLRDNLLLPNNFFGKIIWSSDSLHEFIFNNGDLKGWDYSKISFDLKK